VYSGTVDDTSFKFSREKDRLYSVSVKALGNTTYGNKDALAAYTATHSTFVAPITIENSDLKATIDEIIKTYGDPEYIFNLKSDIAYTISDTLDLGEAIVTLQSETEDAPIVTLGEKGHIETCGGITVDNINFDCTENRRKGGIIELSAYPPASLITGTGNNLYILQNPIIIQNCMFKNVAVSLFATGNASWGVNDVRVDNCIVQMKNGDTSVWGDGAIICAYSVNHYFNGKNGGSWYGCIKNVSVKNSTFYNVNGSNGSNRFLRFSNRDLSKITGSADGSVTIEDCTFCRTYAKKEFANNMGNQSACIIKMNRNNFYDVYRVGKIRNGNNPDISDTDLATNAINYATIKNDDATNSDKIATAEDFSFAGDIDQELDLTKPNGGVNFKADGAISSKGGDPRWR
jgi:hypothetical protein